MSNRILVATKTAKNFLTIKNCVTKYEVIPSYGIEDAIKKAINGKYSLIIIDKEINNSCPFGSLLNFFSQLDVLKVIPIILFENNNNKLYFDNFGFKKRTGYNCEQLQENIDKLVKENEIPFKQEENVANFVQSLILALERRDNYSRNHSARVSKFAKMIAENMGLDNKTIEIIEIAGLFHDIGKIGVPDKILLKPDKLDDDEFAVIKTHPIISEQICKPIKSFEPLLPIIRGHHERYDGRGYPDGKKGDEICLEARIVAVADAFDALTSNRAYRQAFSTERVINILKDGSGTQWDKQIIDSFLENFDETKIKEILRPKKFQKKENLLSGTIFDRSNHGGLGNV